MARKKQKRRRSRSFSKRYRRHSKPKMPIEVPIAGFAIPFTAPRSGFSSPIEAIQNQDLTGLMDALKNGFLGMDGGRGTPNFDFFAFINPFNMESGRYTKMLVLAGIAGGIRRKLVGRYTSPLFKRIPLIGNWVS